MNPFKLAKMAGKISSFDELLVLLEGMGVHVDHTPVELKAEPAERELRAIAQACVTQGKTLHRIVVNKGALVAFVVMGTPQAGEPNHAPQPAE